MAKAIARLSARHVLAKSFRIWARNIVPMTIASALTYLPVLACLAVVPEPRRTCKGLGDIFLPLACGILAWLTWVAMPAAVIHGVLRQLRGEHTSIGACLRVYAKRLLPVLGVGFMIGLVAVPCAIAFGVGAGLLTAVGVPDGAAHVLAVTVAGAATSCLFWVAVPVAVVEKPGALASLRRSLRLTRGARGAVFAISLLSLGIQIVPLYALDTLLGPDSGQVGAWAETLAVVLLATPGAVAIAVGYHDLRAATEGAPVEDVARVFA